MPKSKRRNPEKKATNPKAAMGIRKVPMSCLSSQAIVLVAQAFVEEGLTDHAENTAVRVSEHYNAAQAYLMCFWEGVNDSWKVPNLARSMAHTMVLRAAELDNRLDDDRCEVDGLHVKELNDKAAKIIDLYPKCVEPFLQLPPNTTGRKIAVQITKNTPLHVLPWRVVLEASLGMMEGGRKYGRHNYRSMGVRATVYYDAATRHLADFISGTAVDKDSGLSHLTKALSSSQVLLDSMIMGNWIDDRPLRIK
jgi:hypothetical protein